MELNAQIEKRIAINTKKAYTSDLAYIQRWGNLTFANFNFPMSEHAVLSFVTDHLQGMDAVKEQQLMSLLFRNGYKAKSGLHSLATVRRRLSALNIHHKELGHDNSCFSNKVKSLINTISKTEQQGTKQEVVTEDILDKLLATCDTSLKGIRDKAILLLAWTSSARRSEVIAIQVKHLTSIGSDFLLKISARNFNMSPSFDATITGKAAQALQNWIETAAITEGFIFRSIGKGGKISDNPLSPIDVNRIVKQRCRATGLDDKQFGAHSLRSGCLIGIENRPLL